ncbi:MAG: phage holin family protein [Novosphingobium sp.]|nr:phage holin family protein [Novosphingobium sp.]MCP5402567.1 phage holin family protein [Novosphingobium sp.]
MNDSEPSTARVSGDARERSLPEDLRELAEDARALAEAEFAYQKSRAAFAGQEAKRIAILGLLAAALVFFALMALTLGLVLALTPMLTAWGATAVVVGGLLLVAAICGILAATRWRNMAVTLSEKDPE